MTTLTAIRMSLDYDGAGVLGGEIKREVVYVQHFDTAQEARETIAEDDLLDGDYVEVNEDASEYFVDSSDGCHYLYTITGPDHA